MKILKVVPFHSEDMGQKRSQLVTFGREIIRATRIFSKNATRVVIETASMFIF